MNLDFLQPDETAFDLLKRSGFNPSANPIIFGIPPLDHLLQSASTVAGASPSPIVIEIEGEAATGKTFMLIKLAANVLDAGNNVIYFNLDKRLNPARFPPSTTGKRGEVFIVSPNDCNEFLVCLHHLTALHTIRLVVIDSMLTLFEFSALTDPISSGFPLSIPRVLFDLAKRLGFAIAAAKPTLCLLGGNAVAEDVMICSKTWTQRVSQRISLKRQARGEFWDARRADIVLEFEFAFDL